MSGPTKITKSMIKEIKCNQFKLNKKTFRERFLFCFCFIYSMPFFQCDKHFLFIKLPKFNKNAIYIYIYIYLKL